MLPLLAAALMLFSLRVEPAHRNPPPEQCPQPRFTGKAPAEPYARDNPLEASRKQRRAGRELYEEIADPSCVACHGKKGEGNGPLASGSDPPPRNFTCAQIVDGIPGGQLHWIIENGSPGTGMPPFDYLSDQEIWQLVIYLRSLTEHD